MDIGSLQTLIGTVGFPIACCIAMFWMFNREREDHKESELKLTEAINNNTNVMQRLLDRLGAGEANGKH